MNLTELEKICEEAKAHPTVIINPAFGLMLDSADEKLYWAAVDFVPAAIKTMRAMAEALSNVQAAISTASQNGFVDHDLLLKIYTSNGPTSKALAAYNDLAGE